jgi:hypothetical protein
VGAWLILRQHVVLHHRHGALGHRHFKLSADVADLPQLIRTPVSGFFAHRAFRLAGRSKASYLLVAVIGACMWVCQMFPAVDTDLI